jgi:DNA-binding GntR family transcriptional regulator
MADALANFTPFPRAETLGHRIREQLRDALMSGLFRPGEKLTLRAVAASLGVSLTPVREALFHLVSEGALEMRENGSIYVSKLDRQKIRELVKVRVSLESLAMLEAMPHLTDADIAEIVNYNNQLIEANARQDYVALTKANWHFHFKIYHTSQMPLLIRMIEACWLRTGSYLNVIYPEFAKSDDGVNNHQAILDAIRQGDGKSAAEAIARDIEYSSRGFFAAVSEA